MAFCLFGYFLGAKFQMLQSVVERWGFVLAGALILAYIGWLPVIGRLRGRLMPFRAQALAATELMIRALLAGCQFTREVVGADAQPVVEVEAVGSLALALHARVQVQLLAAESHGFF